MVKNLSTIMYSMIVLFSMTALLLLFIKRYNWIRATIGLIYY